MCGQWSQSIDECFPPKSFRVYADDHGRPIYFMVQNPLKDCDPAFPFLMSCAVNFDIGAQLSLVVSGPNRLLPFRRTRRWRQWVIEILRQVKNANLDVALGGAAGELADAGVFFGGGGRPAEVLLVPAPDQIVEILRALDEPEYLVVAGQGAAIEVARPVRYSSGRQRLEVRSRWSHG